MPTVGPPFRSIIAVDFEFEFGGHAGNEPRPLCMVAKELRTGETWRLWRGEFDAAPPFPVGSDVLIVAYYASAELGCFRALGWPTPARILDLFAEFRNLTNGVMTPAGSGLIGALTYHGLDTIGSQTKTDMRDLVLSGGPWTGAERRAILNYCESDVDALARLLVAMSPRLDLPHALLRGRSMAAAAAIEFNGVPIDRPTLETLSRCWSDIQDALIAAIDIGYNVYEGRTFKAAKFEAFLIQHSIPWPRLPANGKLDLGRDTFRQMSKSYPIIAPLQELRHALSEMRLSDLAVGRDGRNRVLLSAFRSKTGRNQPSNAKFIFGPSTWLRGLIKPPPGHALAYIDWSTQEFGIAAALSGDDRMREAYESGDPYIALGIQSGKLPPDATKKSHPVERELLKQCVLGIQYGMEAPTLAFRIGQPEIVARELLRLHHRTYPQFWSWSDAAVDYAMQGNPLHTVFGWNVRIDANPNPRSLRNYLMQGNGSEMLRLACCLGIERGIEICAPIHDAVLICAPLDRIDHDVAAMRAAMAEASRAVLNGFEIRTDVKVIQYPDRFMDPRGAVMWDKTMALLAQLENAAGATK